MGHVARKGERISVYRFGRGNLRERGHLEDPDVDGRKIMRWIFRKWDGDMDWIDLARDKGK